jgi:hypothetical protein
MVGCEFESGERVMKKGAMDRSILIVAVGSLLSFTDDGENMVYEAGAILGVESFLFNRKWGQDLICGK